MRNIMLVFLLVSLISCVKRPVEIEPLKYTIDDIIPLNDSTKAVYYNDAAYIEFSQVIKDSVTKYEQVDLEEQNIITYYNDLLYIYNNSYSISNSFFEHISSIHSFHSITLYTINVSVDTSKTWVRQWINGNKSTGVAGIDSIIENYDLDISFVYESHGGILFRLNTKVPINFYALIDKFNKTDEFKYIEPEVIIGGGNSISLIVENNYKIYKYSLGWGDCPSGCLNHHYWKVKLYNNEINLLEEYGDPLK